MVAGVACIQNAHVLGFSGARCYEALCCPETQKIYGEAVAYLEFTHDALTARPGITLSG